MTDPSLQSFIPAIRRGRTPIAEQIRSAIRQAIDGGHLAPGARLPSSRDLSIRLGIARGTVRNAFEQLAEEGLIVSGGPAGTWVSDRISPATIRPAPSSGGRDFRRPMEGLVPHFSSVPLPFQMGVPANDVFPEKAWRRARREVLGRHDAGFASYADPRGEPELRAQIAGQLAIGRHLHCDPDQIIVTTGYRQGLAMTLLALNVQGRSAWMEEPGFPVGRRALELAGLSVIPVPVDGEGLEVEKGVECAPDAAIALVTPGQQAPLGVTMSARRRQSLLNWAASSQAWVIEDDYLSELQLEGPAASALATNDVSCRVVHLGSFSKTLSPSLGLGFIMVPVSLVDHFTEVAAMMAPAPDRNVQLSLASFMKSGRYIRHLRKMKLTYRRRSEALCNRLNSHGLKADASGLAMLLKLPSDVNDVDVAEKGLLNSIAPAPLSVWYAAENRMKRGLLLNVVNVTEGNVDKAIGSLLSLF